MNGYTFLRKNHDRISRLAISLKDMNTIRFQGTEHFAHQLVKFMICHHLLRLKHHFKTEQLIKNSVCDIIDLDTFIIYEIESHVHPIVRRKKLEAFYHPLITDIQIVDIKKLKHIKSVLPLRNEIGRYCGLSK